jgi:NFACT N-terminal and middle domains/NFACT protein RNA binding domain
MHNNPVLVARYAKSLNTAIAGSTVVQCVSTSLTSLYFLFSNNVAINIEFAGHHTLFLNPDVDHFPKRNTQLQFRSIFGKRLKSVVPNFPDRSFHLAFEDNISLHVQTYGRHGGIIAEHKGKVIDHFKYKNPPSHFEPPSLDILFSGEANDFQRHHRFVTERMIADLTVRNFFSADEKDQRTIWEDYIVELQGKPLYLNSMKGTQPSLSFYKLDDQDEEYTNDLPAQNDFGRRINGFLRFNHLFEQIKRALDKRKKKAEKSLQSAHIKQSKMTSAEDFRHIGDIIMANMHDMKSGLTSIELFDFYQNKPLVIRLKKDSSPQRNAERYYRKAKNTHVEEDHLKGLIEHLESALSTIEALNRDLLKAENQKELTSLYKRCGLKEEKIAEQKSVPYKQFEFEGFLIWVGKSAQSNDDLLKLGGKNDLWLHAREVAGSHVIIRNAEDKKISKVLLEYAASLAAGHSKNQHETLAAVIYTPIKYVRKFKGANPGQVRVEREDVLLIEPQKA